MENEININEQQITPIKEIIDVKPEKEINIEQNKEYITALPDWDLEPPFEFVRRGNDDA